MSHHSVHQCHSSEHHHEENHLCRIAAKHDLERVKKIVKDAQFFCKRCGRAANDEKNLCDPSKL
ncbi:MAG: hypothetical protein ACYDA8_08655 [Deferrisomatales bacterium]